MPIFVTQTYFNQEFGRTSASGPKRGAGRAGPGLKGTGRTKTKAEIESGRAGPPPSSNVVPEEDPHYLPQTASEVGPGTQAVQMRNFRWHNFSGTINSQHPGDGSCVGKCWYYDGLPANLKHTEAVVMQCAIGGARGSCQGFEVSGIDLRPQGGERAAVVCQNVGREGNPRLGFVCESGEFRTA